MHHYFPAMERGLNCDLLFFFLGVVHICAYFFFFLPTFSSPIELKWQQSPSVVHVYREGLNPWEAKVLTRTGYCFFKY